ncbi:hypothetical protein HB839_02500 [Listeria sp. FSL L7-1699]|uniref:Uncharacterized protein n=1 Tax=Listeria farberi TaxID=2713500 RepID=A0ABR6SJG6_9LIST|nr:hypothetical protein [Listeria farberi]MBC1374394.1 hypothetical protein [Listeria farberi]MBC1380954.1 hypothetical protein [Listeria farberi]
MQKKLPDFTLKQTWENLEIELWELLRNKQQINVDVFLSDRGITSDILAYSKNGRFISNFQQYIVYLYCLNGEYQKAVDFIRTVADYDSYHGAERSFSIIGTFINKPKFGLDKSPYIHHLHEELNQSIEWENFLKMLDYNPFKLDEYRYDEDYFAEKPIFYLSKTVLSLKKSKCFFTGKKLAKGDYVYKVNWNQDEYHYFVEEALEDYPSLKENVYKYENNQYKLTDFSKHFTNVWVNQLFNTNQVTVDLLLDIIVYGYQASAPFELHSIYDFKDFEESKRQVYEAMGIKYIQLLWVLLKCGYEQVLLDKINQYPLYYGITLLVFDYPSFQEQVIKKLNIEGLEETYLLTRKSNMGLKNIKKLADFGRENPTFLDALSVSLQRYEYHLWAAYVYTPYLGNIQWGQHFKGKRGSQFYYFFIYHPEKLPILNECLRTRKLPSGISSGGWSQYVNLDSLYSTIIYYLTVTNQTEDFKYWSDERVMRRSSLSRDKIRQNVVKLGMM